MCRSASYESHTYGHEDPDQLTITAFYVRLCASVFESNDFESASKACPIPDSLTVLLYPPLSNCSSNNNKKKNNISKIPPFSPTTLSLRRIRLPNDAAATDGDVVIVFGNKQRGRAAATKVLSFQVYVGETKLLKGAIRKLEDNNHNSWKMGLCKCELIPRSIAISEVEIWVALDGHVAVGDKVTIKNPMPISFAVDEYIKMMRNNKNRKNKSKLEDIPEETEFRVDAAVDVDVDVRADANPEIEEAAIRLEMDLEVLRKALDMGIWVLCLGLGFMVSKASVTNFRPQRPFS